MAKKKMFHIWEGIYDEFPKDLTSDVFDSAHWSKSQTEVSLRDLDEYSRRDFIAPQTLVHEYPLAQVVASLAPELDRPVCILDFGGGLARSYFPVLGSLPASFQVEFHVVETPEICRQGRNIFQEFRGLFFHESLPGSIARFDVIHAGSSLHYVADWHLMLKELVAYEPRRIIFSGLTAGNIKTFATLQNYYGSKIPVWFWNFQEFVAAVENLKYRLIYQSLLAFSYLGKIQLLPMDNFPPEYRLDRKCNLIFAPNKGPMHDR